MKFVWYSVPKIKHFWTTDPAAGSPVVSKVKARPRNVNINSLVFEQYSPGCVAPNEESIWDKVGVTFMASEMPQLGRISVIQEMGHVTSEPAQDLDLWSIHYEQLCRFYN